MWKKTEGQQSWKKKKRNNLYDSKFLQNHKPLNYQKIFKWLEGSFGTVPSPILREYIIGTTMGQSICFSLCVIKIIICIIQYWPCIRSRYGKLTSWVLSSFCLGRARWSWGPLNCATCTPYIILYSVAQYLGKTVCKWSARHLKVANRHSNVWH